MDKIEQCMDASDKLRELMGDSDLLDALLAAMDTDEIWDCLEFIARMEDIEL